MSSISGALGSAAPARTFEHGGRTYSVGLLTLGLRAAFEHWVIDRELAGLRPCLSPAEFAAVVGGVRNDIPRGVYSFYGTKCGEALATPAGALKLAALLFGCSEDEMAGLLAARADEVNALLQLALADSTPKGAAVPNG